MAIVVKWLTQRIVAPSFVGSIPISRPIENKQEVIRLLFLYFLSEPLTLRVPLR